MKQNLVLWKINKTDKTDKEKERRHKCPKSSVNRGYHCRCCRAGKKINKKTLRITLHTSVQSLGRVQLFVTPWTAARQASLSISNSWSLPKLMSIESVMDAIQPSYPLSSPSVPALNLFQHQGFFQMSQLFASGGQSIGTSASTSVLPMNTQDWSPLGWTGTISLQYKGLSRVFTNTTVQKHLRRSA